MRITTALLDITDTVLLLRAKLGKLRAWDDFLADNRRERQSLNGLTLTPACRMKTRCGSSPMYALKEVQQFIGDVLVSDPSITPEPIIPIMLNVEVTANWQSPLNKFDSKGGLTYLPIEKAVSPTIARSATFH